MRVTDSQESGVKRWESRMIREGRMAMRVTDGGDGGGERCDRRIAKADSEEKGG